MVTGGFEPVVSLIHADSHTDPQIWTQLFNLNTPILYFGICSWNKTTNFNIIFHNSAVNCESISICSEVGWIWCVCVCVCGHSGSCDLLLKHHHISIEYYFWKVMRVCFVVKQTWRLDNKTELRTTPHAWPHWWTTQQPNLSILSLSPTHTHV